jgi:lantibiotic modifying enzyme
VKHKWFACCFASIAWRWFVSHLSSDPKQSVSSYFVTLCVYLMKANDTYLSPE